MDKGRAEKKSLLDEYLSWQNFGGTIVLSPEWSVEVPLWPQSQRAHELVPEPLLGKIVAWQSIFDSNYRWGEDARPAGWLTEAARNQWEKEAPVIVAELENALEGKAELIVDLWPIVPSEENRKLQEYSARRKIEAARWHSVLKEAGINLSRRIITDEDVRAWESADPNLEARGHRTRGHPRHS